MDPDTLLARNSKMPLEEAKEGEGAVARKEGLSRWGEAELEVLAGARVEAARSREEETSRETWKRESTAGKTEEMGVEV
ncbi:hypothetical protein Sjap_010843 [Stephania japonica]|uniref:Uncharacterized protein n=1 Tax=Stephania japonica TaxID=461633 RepID=A0AAP0JA69_9MAGN